MYHQGEKNGNYKHKYDRTFFKNIDTCGKAYFLGWIASDGTVAKGSITIAIKNYDNYILWDLAKLIRYESFIPGNVRNTLSSIRLNSTEISSDVCKHLQIALGKKATCVKFPKLKSKELKIAFLRGFFDGDGSISNCKNQNYPRCSICTSSNDMLDAIKKITATGYIDYKNHLIYWDGSNAIDFLDILYKDPSLPRLRRKHERFEEWCHWNHTIKWKYASFTIATTHPDAVFPSKVHRSDVGFDLTLIEKIKTEGDVEVYSTGIKVAPLPNYFFMLVPRSSLHKKGYLLANSVGIIDPSYRGDILVALYKADKSKPSLSLPCKGVQLIILPYIMPKLAFVDEFSETIRGAGGFGSTD